MPSTTALSTSDPKGMEKGILAGANVIMPNLTPNDERRKYELYDNKAAQGIETIEMLRQQMRAIGYELSAKRGDYGSVQS